MSSETGTSVEPAGLADNRLWTTVTASQMGLIVDGEQYFRAAKEAMLQAKHSIMLIGWDFDARSRLEPGPDSLEGPDKIGDFLNWLADRTPDLTIRLLKWDLGVVKSLARGETPLFVLDWMARKNVRLKLDGAHPKAAAHHMKLVVIDDALAFCGGIDMTVGRWDTRDHTEGDERRTSPHGKPMGPWHDATSCLTGPAAVKLGDLARARWERATGEKLDPISGGRIAWPSEIDAEFTDVTVGIARTFAEYKEHPEIREIEALTLDIIGRARKTLYIENQYLASRTIAEAMAERLKEHDGPEIVIIGPDSADGWLEAKAMDSARSRLIDLLLKADHNNRFRYYYPCNAVGTPIYVHAKIMIADDTILKIGSANLNNRSMGYDTELDVLIDAEISGRGVCEAIRGRRHDLMAEHLGVETEVVTAAMAETGSMIATIERLLGTPKRLVVLEPEPLSPDEEMLAESDLADPETLTSFGDQIASLFRRHK